MNMTSLPEKQMNTDNYFEGFKPFFNNHILGQVNDWNFSNDNVSSNLFIIPKEKKEQFIAQIKTPIDYNIEDNENDFAIISQADSEHFTMLLVIVENVNNSGIILVNPNLIDDDVLHLLDDSRTNNDCLYAFEELKNTWECALINDDEYVEVNHLLQSQLSQKGRQNIEQYEPELLLKQNSLKVKP